MNWVPSWWAFVLLSLAAYRVTRLFGWDYITRPVREPLTGRQERGDAKQARDTTNYPAGQEASPESRGWRHHVDVFFHCPFCSGWWMALSWYVLWLIVPTTTLAVATPFALSAVIGLVTKNFDA